MKALKWLGVIAAMTVLLIIGAVLLLLSAARQQEVVVEPLSVAELQRLAPKTGARAAPVQRNIEGDSTPGLPERPASEGGIDKFPDRRATRAVTRGNRSTNRPGDAPGGNDGSASSPGDVPGGNAEPAVRPAQPLRLASRPTREQMAKNGGYWGADKPGWWKREFEASGKRVVGAALRMILSDDSIVPGPVGAACVSAGDLDIAIPYLREAVRIEKDEADRRLHCSQLAWLEEDPEVAAELVVQSCRGEPADSSASEWDARRSRTAACNAIALAVVTDSEDLAEYVFQSYRDSWSQWLSEWHGFSPEVQTWLDARLQRE